MRKGVIILFSGIALFCLAGAGWAGDVRLQGTLTAEVTADKKLNVVYTVRNTSSYMIGPSSTEKYRYSIRRVTGTATLMSGNLDGAYQTNVSQYVAPYSHAVFAIKSIALPTTVLNNPGFYLIYLSSGPINHGEETVFYVPGTTGAE